MYGVTLQKMYENRTIEFSYWGLLPVYELVNPAYIPRQVHYNIARALRGFYSTLRLSNSRKHAENNARACRTLCRIPV